MESTNDFMGEEQRMFPRLLVQFSVGIFIEEGHVNPLMGMQTILKAMKGFWFWFAKNNSRQQKIGIAKLPIKLHKGFR